MIDGDVIRYHYSSCYHGHDLTIDPNHWQIDVVDQTDQYHPQLLVDDHDAHRVLVRDGGKWEGTVLLDDDDDVVAVDVDYHSNYDCTVRVPEVAPVPVQHEHLYHEPPVAGGRVDVVDHAPDDPMMNDGFDGRTYPRAIGDDHEDGGHDHLTIRGLSCLRPDDDFLFGRPYQFQQYSR